MADSAAAWLADELPQALYACLEHQEIAAFSKICGDITVGSSIIAGASTDRSRADRKPTRLLEVLFRALFRSGLVPAQISCRNFPELIILYRVFAEHGLRCSTFESHTVNSLSHIVAASSECSSWEQIGIYDAILHLHNIGVLPETAITYPGVEFDSQPLSDPELFGYQVTHQIFYATDLGRKRGRISQANGRAAAHLLSAIWDVGASAANIDLACEVFMCHKFLGLPFDVAPLFHQIAANRSVAGFFNAPKIFHDQLLPNSIDRKLRNFLDNYHTTIVCLAALADSGPPPITIHIM